MRRSDICPYLGPTDRADLESLITNRNTPCSAAQQYPGQFEIIVIDNYTSDPALWRSIEPVCAALGPRFRFSHCVNVVGAKAGTLNIALSQTRPDATHIVTVDANLRHLRAFDAVCGAVAPIEEERDILRQMSANEGQNEAEYRALVQRFYALVYPEPHNPLPHHGEAPGASLAVGLHPDMPTSLCPLLPAALALRSDALELAVLSRGL